MLPTTEENCILVTVTDEEVDNLVKHIPKLDTLVGSIALLFYAVYCLIIPVAIWIMSTGLYACLLIIIIMHFSSLYVVDTDTIHILKLYLKSIVKIQIT